jgi:octaprenyl-diphosphate synthase
LSTFKSITQLVEQDFLETNQVIITQLQSDVSLVNQLGHYIVASGGKRLRSLLVLLVSKALNYQGKEHHNAAAIIEFIHTATLLHDDVVDESERRRGKKTAHTLFGNSASVLVGDFLYSRAFQMMVKIKNMDIMTLLSETTNKIAEGEVLQLMLVNDPKTTEAHYFQVITHKTAILFASSCEIGAIIADASELRTALYQYGLHLGLAYQLMDDILDYTADNEALGKNIGDDLSEGKPTLPLIHALKKANEADRSLIEKCIQKGSRQHFEAIQQILQKNESIEYTLNQAKKHVRLAKKSLSHLPQNQWTQALLNLADLSIQRIA